jgi:hypothetical protein
MVKETKFFPKQARKAERMARAISDAEAAESLSVPNVHVSNRDGTGRASIASSLHVRMLPRYAPKGPLVRLRPVGVNT